MQIQIAYLKTEEQALIKTINTKEGTMNSRLVDSISLIDENLQMLFFSEQSANLISHSEFAANTKLYPCLDATKLNLNFEQFEQGTYQDTFKLYFSNISRELLKNNLRTISEIFELSTHLKTLWQKDRYAFMHEIWFLLRTNLGTAETKILFHDVLMSEADEENKKHKLIYSCLNANLKPNIEAASAPLLSLAKNLEAKVSSSFSVLEFFPERGDLLIAAEIEKSPIFIMAKASELNQLQQTILATLFKSLN